MRHFGHRSLMGYSRSPVNTWASMGNARYARLVGQCGTGPSHLADGDDSDIRHPPPLNGQFSQLGPWASKLKSAPSRRAVSSPPTVAGSQYSVLLSTAVGRELGCEAAGVSTTVMTMPGNNSGMACHPTAARAADAASPDEGSAECRSENGSPQDGRHERSDPRAGLLPRGALVRVPRVGDLRRGQLPGVLRARPLPVLVPRQPHLWLRTDALTPPRNYVS